ncbi:lipoyl(octanoyl) transferase LipB [Egibacter rhizosphaerae]|uniref:Octanoyltransferase n=1 Tax=Egibacter rhizosphaerae TaxID=1670831 RepID=A0A411YAM1_9ACTN|nr:lipoyl(octanoyl) transferase LipB [Egibacter rhizosphaerae]QBI18228.1 lipoyl(octanoyl) transferase LipB [Egibacter rhizosphaerae]
MLAVWCGEVPYEDALRWQRQLVTARAADEIDDVVLVLTHDPVYTAGRRADVAAHVLGRRNIRLVEVERGGDVTYHGPGQIVCYPIRKLPHAKAVRSHVEALERACAETARSYGVQARASHELDDDAPIGVWVARDKLAAIGVAVDGRVTSHGLALNVDPDLSHYLGIVACGLGDRGVTSLVAQGVDTHVDEVRRRLVPRLGEALGVSLQPARPSDLGLTLDREPAHSKP